MLASSSSVNLLSRTRNAPTAYFISCGQGIYGRPRSSSLSGNQLNRLQLHFKGLKRWDEGRRAEGCLWYTALCWGSFPIPHLPLPDLLCSPIMIQVWGPLGPATEEEPEDVDRFLGGLGFRVS